MMISCMIINKMVTKRRSGTVETAAAAAETSEAEAVEVEVVKTKQFSPPNANL